MTSSAARYGATSGPVAVTVHGSGDILIPLVTLEDVPASGADLKARLRACLAELGLLAADD